MASIEQILVSKFSLCLLNIRELRQLIIHHHLIQVIETFQLKINEDNLMSRCTKCNGRFIQKPLTTEEAIAAGKGFQIIPQCLYDRNIEFWQCTDCNQLYWEVSPQYNYINNFILFPVLHMRNFSSSVKFSYIALLQRHQG